MNTEAQRRTTPYEYDVCLSFAGENRDYVSAVADHLIKRGIRVFYDEYEESNLWGKDLFQHLDFIYTNSARFCVVFISKDYERKVWTNHEIRSAQARAFQEKGEYILPARFDDTEIPGIRPTMGFIDLRRKKESECANLIIQKLSPYKLLEFHERDKYFPPNPDILFKAFRIRSKADKRLAYIASYGFFRALERLNDNERRLIFIAFLYGCAHDHPENIHIEIDLLRRIAGWPTKRVLSTISGIGSLGFEVKLCDSEEKEIQNPSYVYIRWVLRNMELAATFEDDRFYCTAIALVMVQIVANHYCEDHAIDALMRLNFSSLSTATAVADTH